MEKSYPLLKPLTDQLMKEVRAYGILEVSTEQYQTSCNQILSFAKVSQVDHYSPTPTRITLTNGVPLVIYARSIIGSIYVLSECYPRLPRPVLWIFQVESNNHASTLYLMT